MKPGFRNSVMMSFPFHMTFQAHKITFVPSWPTIQAHLMWILIYHILVVHLLFVLKNYATRIGSVSRNFLRGRQFEYLAVCRKYILHHFMDFSH